LRELHDSNEANLVSYSGNLQGQRMGRKQMIVYDFYSGTGSSTKAFEDAGHTIIKVELDEYFEADERDILQLTADYLVQKYGQRISSGLRHRVRNSVWHHALDIGIRMAQQEIRMQLKLSAWSLIQSISSKN